MLSENPAGGEFALLKGHGEGLVPEGHNNRAAVVCRVGSGS